MYQNEFYYFTVGRKILVSPNILKHKLNQPFSWGLAPCCSSWNCRVRLDACVWTLFHFDVRSIFHRVVLCPADHITDTTARLLARRVTIMFAAFRCTTPVPHWCNNSRIRCVTWRHSAACFTDNLNCSTLYCKLSLFLIIQKKKNIKVPAKKRGLQTCKEEQEGVIGQSGWCSVKPCWHPARSRSQWLPAYWHGPANWSKSPGQKQHLTEVRQSCFLVGLSHLKCTCQTEREV